MPAHGHSESRLRAAKTAISPREHLPESFDYTDFGVPKDPATWADKAASSTGTSFLFAGKYYDWETGLYDSKARLYDPKTGRFTSRDPLGMWADAASFGNGYTYAGNSPWTNVDTTGLSSVYNPGPNLEPGMSAEAAAKAVANDDIATGAVDPKGKPHGKKEKKGCKTEEPTSLGKRMKALAKAIKAALEAAEAGGHTEAAKRIRSRVKVLNKLMETLIETGVLSMGEVAVADELMAHLALYLVAEVTMMMDVAMDKVVAAEKELAKATSAEGRAAAKAKIAKNVAIGVGTVTAIALGVVAAPAIEAAAIRAVAFFAPRATQLILSNGYITAGAGGMKMTERYYKRLWKEGRSAPFIVANEILKHGKQMGPDKYPGFFRYELGRWEMIYNPVTREIWHMQIFKK